MKEISYEELNKMLNSKNPNDINLDDDDIKTILKNKDLFFIDVCEYKDDNELKSVMQSTHKLEFKNMKSSILICFHIHPNYNIIKITNIMDTFNMTYNDAEFIIFCTSTNEKISENGIKATIIMTFSKKLY
ncbi:MAG: hypothetical protein PHO62_01955 [Sulfurimonas sp.]|uniref:hypothetical protein n=1 Tax=Sulfurimonas sp. TaxID=2022749 RepID=UPI0026332E3B|nr:hypothetical protein [Sulfurimonas sp.]MDD5372171.1 hypothetical protein [Sulfurimonas sp.]